MAIFSNFKISVVRYRMFEQFKF